MVCCLWVPGLCTTNGASFPEQLSGRPQTETAIAHEMAENHS